MRNASFWCFSAIVVYGSIGASFAQGSKLIECAGDRIYRDYRTDGGGGQVFCEHILPGSLTVKDGPFRFWFNHDFEGASGNYNEGRQIGKWKECDRFGRCEQKDYPEIYPEEKQRAGFKPEIPAAFLNGKYVFDFASCRSTWVTYTAVGKPDLELNISAERNGCFIAFIRGGNTDYTCTIPFQTGSRAFDSLELISELPAAGIQQYCARQVLKTGPYMSSVDPNHGEGASQVFTVEFSLGNNGVGIAQARLHFQERAESRSNRCVVRYDPGSKSLFLLSDRPGKYLGPIAAGGNASLWNSQCFLAGCSTAEVTNDGLKVHFAIRFNPAQFAGSHNMFLEMVDTDKTISPAPVYGNWTVPTESGAATSAWPLDRSCPVAAPVPRLGIYSSSAVNCKDVSGTWSDLETGGSWALTQIGDNISGSLTIAKAECGSVTWKVSGQVNNGLASLRATDPSPAVDACGKPAASSIAATLAPDCSTGKGRVEIKK